ncbi:MULTISPECIES: membrane protein insertase YidC [unclassified Granulicatella]|uniref:membrane protein insertase YidC n=1 Tax=unclassified Granulicatella TaxID=2630493 RepID=UPI001073C395|nr:MULTISPECIES: membrane protein insertase YidC [unclassified Granulicatella]MBF0780011.1 membrane protein insertase YidC [Granulicatella sp. 19428wC4_WM01]TFU95937.1 membrane protein insertase YidC [Granulicatella sp. WM01]
MNFKTLTRRSTLLIFCALCLVGCVERTVDGQPTGLIWTLFGYPMEQAIRWFAQLFNAQTGSYAWGIIFVTIIVRIFLTPINLKMMRKNVIQQERLSYVRPEINRLNEQMKHAKSTQEKMAVRQAITEVQQAAGINPFDMGCLLMLIQIPIVSALFYAVSSSPDITKDIFFGIELNKPSLLLAIVSSAFYLLQGLISQYGMPAEQKAVGRSLVLTSPILNFSFALVAPAGAALYWTIGGVFACLTSIYSTFVQKPRLKKEIALELEKNPIVLPQRKDTTPPPTQTPTLNTNKPRRNEGKQRK